jgi:hypothetical protein
VHLPTPGLPRTPDGKPDLKAAAPKNAEGKPFLSGLWGRASDKYYNNIAADQEPGVVQTWAEALYQQRRKDFSKDSMETRKLPPTMWGEGAFLVSIFERVRLNGSSASRGAPVHVRGASGPESCRGWDPASPAFASHGSLVFDSSAPA